jgi:hypothetical protein
LHLAKIYQWRAFCNAADAARWAVGLGINAMDLKVTFLIALFGAIIGLSLIGEGHVARLKDQWTMRRWRKAVLGQTKS